MMNKILKYDVIVVGGGHAGVEAVNACVKLGMKVLLICLNFSKVSNMPCNPHIGGSAKGIVVREVDALGGLMGVMADNPDSLLQIKELNTSKGPGVRCLRAQEDKIVYPQNVQKYLSSLKNLDIIEGEVKELLVENSKAIGIRLENNEKIFSKVVILSCGTHLESRILRGHTIENLGPDGEKSSHGLSLSLQSNGIKMMRLKTGTPPRLAKESINFNVLKEEEGEDLDFSFSYDSKTFMKKENMVKCYLAYSNKSTHEIIKDHLKDSAMYGGVVEGVGPRYCPSIEDKVVRFKDKDRHQLFLEPESKLTNSIYIDGFSTSMPIDVQNDMIHSIVGLENAKFLKYAYAIEYDALYPLQVKNNLETRKIENLFVAGQLLGTSGYEEAAALGLMAGVNACLKIKGLDKLVLQREQAYIGIMIDDITTKACYEPYRLLSSRSEYRLLTRSDNADSRLLKIGYDVGLNTKERYERIGQKDKNVKKAIEVLNDTKISNNNKLISKLNELGYSNLNYADTLKDTLKKQNVSYLTLFSCCENLPVLDCEEQKKIEIEVKYEGYINLQLKEASKRLSYMNLELPSDLDYSSISGISLEAREKLNLIKPKNIKEASMISNVHPSDIDVLSFFVRHKDK